MVLEAKAQGRDILLSVDIYASGCCANLGYKISMIDTRGIIPISFTLCHPLRVRFEVV